MELPSFPSDDIWTSKWSIPVALALLILLPRAVGIAVTMGTELNPFSHGQALSYPVRAETTAQNLLNGDFTIDTGGTTRRVGSIFFPLYVLPGPSVLYHHLAISSIAAVAIYNVYVIGRHCHSELAGIVAVLPLAVFPSHVMVHSTLQREALVLLGVTTAVRVLLAPPRQWSRWMCYFIAGGGVFMAIYARLDNAIIIAIVAGVCMLAYAYYWRSVSLPAFLAVLVPAYFFERDLTWEYLAQLRERRARGRTEYLPEYVPQSAFEMIMFSWIASVYFVFVPFPWMVDTVADFAIMLESLLTIGLACFAVKGVVVLYRRNPVGAIGLMTGIIVASVLYGQGTANVGTAVRHRTGMLWIVFLLGGIGIASWLLDPATTKMDSRAKRASRRLSRELPRRAELPTRRLPNSRSQDRED